jgi:diguanylate cyclase (GGDEF)-like protein
MLLYESTHDSFTGLRNQGRLTSELADALALHRCYGQRFGLIYLDIDDFKKIDDTHGHLVGEQLLHSIAPRWSVLVRATDLLA